MSTKYRTSPDQTRTTMPPGIPFIIGNELAERFSFYGMKGILTVFMTKHLLDSAGQPAYMDSEEAKSVYHLFTAGAYFFPMLGAILADVLWGKYKTILFISLMYCVGHGMLALMDLGPQLGLWDMAPFLFVGLLLIAIGAGGIKPCVSANVGDQFGSGNKHLLTQVFNWFYFSINVGAAASTLLTPVLLAEVGPWAAFGLPGLLMGIATLIFWLGRHKFVHVPPAGWDAWVKETFSPEGKRALINLAPLFLLFVPMFWAIFDQTGSAWVLQADKMDCELGIIWLPSQVQAVNPLMILIGIPVFTYLVYPFMGRFFDPTPLRKIGIGLVLTALAFGISALIEQRIEDRQDSIAATMYRAMADDVEPAVRAGTMSEAQRESLSRAALTGSSVGKWSNADLATALGSSEESIALIRANAVVLDPEASLAILRAMSEVDPEKRSPLSLNGAVAAARILHDSKAWPELDWDKARVNSFMREMPNILWQFLAYLILTSGEIMVSIVCLEFAYTQSPKKMKSFIMGIYFLGVSLGNLFVSGVNFALGIFKNEDGSTALDGANYYWFFAALMGVTIVVYLVWTRTYKGQTYIQGEDESDRIESQAEGPDAR